MFATSVTTAAAASACFLPLLARYRGREVGGGRATRQPGQVRKEAALTSSGSGRSSASHQATKIADTPDASGTTRALAGGMMNDALDPGNERRFALEPAEAAAAYRVLARKYRPQTFDDLIGQGA